VLPESVSERAPKNPSPHPLPQGEGEKNLDLACPLCGYSLYGLPEPRCPECGYQFEWPALIAQRQLRESWFFEHAGTFRSLLKTRWRSLRPFRFWREVQPAWEIRAGRLGTYLFLTLAITVLLYGVLLYALPPAINGGLDLLDKYLPPSPGKPVMIMVPSSRSPTGSTPYPFTPRAVPWRERFGIYPRNVESHAGLEALSAVVLTIVTPLFWLLLRASARRFHLRAIQFARVVTYLMDVLPLISLLPLGLTTLLALHHEWFWFGGLSAILRFHLIATELVLLLVGLRIFVAAKYYLRLPHAGAIAAVYIIIATLTYGCIFLQLYPLM